MSALDDLLRTYRDAAVTEREKGTYFERLACAYLTTDPVQAEEYSQVSTWSEWAADNGWNGKDVGIDLVAKLRNEEGFAAIQCKFYKSSHRIQKADIDSFISASGKAPFARRSVSDANDYANETMNNPAYPLELFQRVITVSIETMKIVRALPKLDLQE